MMQLMREKAHGIVAWTIIVVITIAFCSWGASNYLSSSSGPIAAVVNGKKIPVIQIEDIYSRWLRHYSASDKNFDITKINPNLVKQQITQGIAQQFAIINGLQHDGFAVSDEMLVSNIQQDINLQENGKFSIELYKKSLEQLNMAESQFEQARRDDLLMDQVQQGIVGSSFVLKNEVDQVLKIRNQKRSFGYAIIPAAKFKSAVSVTPEQINEFYTQHAAAFVNPEKVQVEYLELSLDDLMKKIEVTDQKLREYYAANMNVFADPELLHVRHIMIAVPQDADADSMNAAKAKIDAVYSKLQKGESFVELAKNSSDDQLTATKGGDLGWVSKNDNLPAEIFVLTKANDYTPVVQSNFGLHIFQLVARKEHKEKDFNAIKSTIESRYKRDAAEQLFTTEGEELARLTAEHQDSLVTASEKLKLPIKTTDYFTRQSGGTGVAATRNVIAAAFSELVLKDRKNSNLVPIGDNSYIVLRIKDVKPQTQLPLAEVQPQIMQQLQKVALEAKTKQVGEEIVAEIKSGVAPSKAAASKNIEWQTANDIARENKKLSSNILQLAFTMGRPSDGQAHTTADAKLPNGDYLVVVLNKVQDGAVDKQTDANLEQGLASQMAILKGRLEFSSLQTYLIAKAKIKYLAPQSQKLE